MGLHSILTRSRVVLQQGSLVRTRHRNELISASEKAPFVPPVDFADCRISNPETFGSFPHKENGMIGFVSE